MMVRNNFPIPGRTNQPLLFDRNLNPKSAFHAILPTDKGARRSAGSWMQESGIFQCPAKPSGSGAVDFEGWKRL